MTKRDDKGLTGNAIEIFRPGRHTSMTGDRLEFSEGHLQATADVYDPAVHEAPIVVGHPKHDSPAYGWIGSLSFAEGSLMAAPRQVNPDFAELVEGGAFKKVSASFYTPDADSNPAPGAYYLRHVGFLGAQPPAVKGLAPVAFADGEPGVVTVEFSEADLGWSLKSVVQLFRRLRDYLIETEGPEKAEEIIPANTLEWAGHDATTAIVAADDDDTSFSEEPAVPPAPETPDNKETPPMKTGETPNGAADGVEEKQRALDEDRARLDKDKAAFAEARAKANAAAFVDGQVLAGRILPAEKDGLVAFMAALDAEETVSFAEGDEKQTQCAFMQKFIESLPKRIEFSELSGADDDPVDVNNGVALGKQAQAFMEEQRAKGVTITASEAVAHIKKGADQ